MKYDFTIRIKYLRFMAFYSLIMLCIIFFLFFNQNDRSVSATQETTTDESTSNQSTQYIYVHPPEITTESETEEEIYNIKEYNGHIGIFSADGTLLQILDTNVKTLPEADKSLLREGFEVIGKSQLNSIIEDYTE